MECRQSAPRCTGGISIGWVSAQELERSLDCEHIAPDAAQALRKVYTAMHEMEPEGGRYIAQWARILMRPNLRHIEQACDSLEQSVMGDGAEAELPPENQIRGGFECTLMPATWGCNR